MSLLLASEKKIKWLKSFKKQIIFEKRRYTYNAVYGLKQRSQTFKNIQNKVFSPLLDSWLPLVEN